MIRSILNSLGLTSNVSRYEIADKTVYSFEDGEKYALLTHEKFKKLHKKLYKVRALMVGKRSAFMDHFPVTFHFGEKPTKELIDRVFTAIEYKKGPYVYGKDLSLVEITEVEIIKY